MLTYHQQGPLTFIWGQSHKSYTSHQSQKLAFKITLLKFHLNLPGVNELDDSHFVEAPMGQPQSWFKACPSKWETLLQSNALSHWLGANLEPALNHICGLVVHSIFIEATDTADALGSLGDGLSAVTLLTYGERSNFDYPTKSISFPLSPPLMMLLNSLKPGIFEWKCKAHFSHWWLRCLFVKLPLVDGHLTSLMISQHWFR